MFNRIYMSLIAFVLISTMVLSASLAVAKTDNLHKAANELCEATYDNSSFSQIAVQISDLMLQNTFKKVKMNAKDRDTLAKAFREVMQEVLADQKLHDVNKKIISDVYVKYYTEKEIVELTNFYKTDVGKKSLKVLPSMMQDIQMKMVQSFQPMLIKAFSEKLPAKLAKLKKDGAFSKDFAM